MKILSGILLGIVAILLIAACNMAYAESEDAAAYNDEALCADHAAYIRRTVRSVRETAHIINRLQHHVSIEGARCDDESCSGGIISKGGSDGTSEILSVCERFIFINGQPFVSSLGNTFLPDLTTMSALEALVNSIYSREMTNAIMTDLTVPSWHWGNPKWGFVRHPVPIFIEVDGVLFSWVPMVAFMHGPLTPWAEGYIHIENVEIIDGEIISFSVIVNERLYFVPDWPNPEGNGWPYATTPGGLLRLTFIREGGALKINSIEEASHQYAHRFDTFVTFGDVGWAADFLFNTQSAFVFFGDETCDATLDIIDKVIALSIATGQTVYYFNMHRIRYFAEFIPTSTILERFNVTAAAPKLIYVHENGFDVVFGAGIDRLGEFFGD